MAWGAVAAAAVSALGNAASGSSAKNASRDQMSWQTMMSNTAHQREVSDLRAAGINPILSAKLGGASTPSGSSYQTPNIGDAAVKGYEAGTNVSLQKAATAKTVQDTAVSATQADLNKAQKAKAEAEKAAIEVNAARTAFDLERDKYLQTEYRSWDNAGSRDVVSTKESDLRSFYIEQEYDARHQLDALATRKGFKNFMHAIQDTEFRQQLQNLALGTQTLMQRGLDTNRLSALSDFYGSSFGRDVAPYLGSAGQASGIASDVLGGLSIGKKLLGIPNNLPVRKLRK